MAKPKARLFFPLYGLHKGNTCADQVKFTSPLMNNVRPYDVQDNRARGGQRPGLDKWGAGVQVGAAEQPVVAICTVSAVA